MTEIVTPRISNEAALIMLLETILETMKTGKWIVTDYESDFSNEVSMLTHKSLEKKWVMEVTIRRKVGA